MERDSAKDAHPGRSLIWNLPGSFSATIPKSAHVHEAALASPPAVHQGRCCRVLGTRSPEQAELMLFELLPDR